MIRKSEFLNWIDDYFMDQLSSVERNRFEEELRENAELSDELELQKEIQEAILEKDVLELRNKLKVATRINQTAEQKESFNILDDFADIKELADSVSTEDLINFYDSLPKAHVYQHDLVASENITEFYKEQEADENKEENPDDELSVDFDEFEGLEEAILEKDVLDLRDTLAQVSKSVQPQFSTSDIDKYMNGELDEKELELFENELEINRTLREEVHLHKEMDLAMSETEILKLKAELASIMDTETSWKVSEENLDAFLEGTLEGADLDEFLKEYSHNTDLISEVNFQNELSEAVLEKDVMELREKVKIARDQAEKTELRAILPTTGSKVMKKLRNVAAIAVIVLGVAGLLNNMFSPYEKSYDRFYNGYVMSAERAVSENAHKALDEANYLFLNGQWNEAIKVLKNAEKSTANSFAYSYNIASIYQDNGSYKKAIANYDKVLAHGDNMFIEEAEWKKGLCLLKIGNKELAKRQMLAVIDRNSYYKKDAKAVLRKLRYSVK